MGGHGHRPHHAGPPRPVLPGHALGRRTVRQQDADGADRKLVPEIAANLQRRARQRSAPTLDERQFSWVTARTRPHYNATCHAQHTDRAGLLRRVKGQTQAQKGRSFHGYYDRHLPSAKLRRSNVDASAGALEEVYPVVQWGERRMGRLRPLVRRVIVPPSPISALGDPTRLPFWLRP